MVCLYFVLGSLATKVKMEEKERKGIAEKRSGRRGPGSVWGSGLGECGVSCKRAWDVLLVVSCYAHRRLRVMAPHVTVDGDGYPAAAMACACVALATGTDAPWRLGFVASLTSKLSDTVSSELGKAFGKTPYLVTTFKR